MPGHVKTGHLRTTAGASHPVRSNPHNPTVVTGTLPFTGLHLTLFLLLAMALGALGVTLRFGTGRKVIVR
jgi:hypothetical protein